MGERYPDAVEVGGSKPPAPTRITGIKLQYLRASQMFISIHDGASIARPPFLLQLQNKKNSKIESRIFNAVLISFKKIDLLFIINLPFYSL